MNDMHPFIIPCCFVISLFSSASNALHITNETIEKYLLSKYDYVVVGGGLSGLVVANRLSEDSDCTMICL